MTMPDSFFRSLDGNEETEFRQAARLDYKPGAPIDEVWHPVYRDECHLINKEAAPYPGCRQPDVCRGYCTRDPNCGE